VVSAAMATSYCSIGTHATAAPDRSLFVRRGLLGRVFARVGWTRSADLEPLARVAPAGSVADVEPRFVSRIDEVWGGSPVDTSFRRRR
jgi:hypothetical protein